MSFLVSSLLHTMKSYSYLSGCRTQPSRVRTDLKTVIVSRMVKKEALMFVTSRVCPLGKRLLHRTMSLPRSPMGTTPLTPPPLVFRETVVSGTATKVWRPSSLQSPFLNDFSWVSCQLDVSGPQTIGPPFSNRN